MKGILLCGGTGSRLGELTRVVNKHLLPVGRVPMLYHPLTRLIEAGCDEVCIVSTTEGLDQMGRQIRRGKFLDKQLPGVVFLAHVNNQLMSITWMTQAEPLGIAHAIGLCEQFADGQRVLVVLGDNVFDAMPMAPQSTSDLAWCWVTQVHNPKEYGVVEFAAEPAPWLTPVSIEEKPAVPKSTCIAVGIYSLPPDVFDVIRTLKQSERGEYEIVDVLRWYMERKRLQCVELTGWWFDCGGSPEALARASIEMLLLGSS